VSAASGALALERLRAALTDPTALIDDRRAAQAAALLRGEALAVLDRALGSRGVEGLVVKGAALAPTVYAEPWMRPMLDIDVVVRPHDEEAALDALAAAGGEPIPPPGWRFSRARLGERQIVLSMGIGKFLVEVHRTLDSIVPRPVAYEEIFARSNVFLEHRAALRVAALEDSALLVVLHAAVSDFQHPVAWVDLDHLLRLDLDLMALVERAQRWRLRTAAYVAFTTLRALGSRAVPDSLLERLIPSPLRLRALERFYRVGHYPVRDMRGALGLPWIVRQTPLRDDPWRWVLGLASYGSWRLLDRAWARTYGP
jgi:hypothetical protein